MKSFIYAFAAWIFCHLSSVVKAGTVWPGGTTPIALSISNAKEYALYTFNFYCDSDVFEDSHIVIDFPFQYQENLGIPLWAQCSDLCEVMNRRVTFWPSQFIQRGSNITFWIEGIKNPASSGKIIRWHW
jgi:hypothetical protein